MAFESNRQALHTLQKAWNAETSGRGSG